MPNKYIAVELKDRCSDNDNPKFMVYTESSKGIEEVVCSTLPRLLAFEFMCEGLQKKNPTNYRDCFALSFELTISTYISPLRYGDQGEHSKSHIYDVTKMSDSDREDFEKELFSRLGL